ncbi:membrane protein [Bacillus sp. X1(2014)]|nr:membrane protein [Bacillus sp. X1(2014)]
MNEWSDLLFRTFLFILCLFLVTKLLGKKQISQLTFFEYISGITIGSIAGEAITGLEKNLLQGLTAIVIFGVVTYLADYLSLKSKKFRNWVEGKGTVVIKDGKILEDNLKKERYTVDELSSLLRQQNIFNVADVEFALIEPEGRISALLKKEHRPLTPKDLQMKMPNEKEPQTVIIDGKILDGELTEAGKGRGWLYSELEKLGVTLDNVFMGQVNSYGELTVDLYDDKIQVPSPAQRPLLLASLKKAQADLEIFSLSTDCEKSKAMYKKNADLLQETINKLSPFLNG